MARNHKTKPHLEAVEMSNYAKNTYVEDENTSWFKIANLIKDKSRVLDVGCSSGNLGEFLQAQKECEVVGVDLNEKDVAKAKTKLSEAYVMNVETDDIEKLGKFDCIIFADVIEHLVDPSETLRKIKKLLKKNGVVIFSIPNMAHISTRLMLMSGKFEYGESGLLDKTHLHFYDSEEIVDVFEKAGYSIDTFGWVDKEYSEKVLQIRLKKLGLTPDKKFFKLAKGTGAVAYQYVGSASASSASKSSRKVPEVSPVVASSWDQMQEVQINHAEEIESIKNEYSVEIERLKKINLDITGSLSWRITKPFRAFSDLARKLKK